MEKKKKIEGKIIKNLGKTYEIITPNEELYHAVLPGKWRMCHNNLKNIVAIGDMVTFHVEKDTTAVIQTILPRKNCIIRQATYNKHQQQILASNIDQALLIVSYLYPFTSLGFIDRILAYMNFKDIETKIIYNKVDLLSPKKNMEMQKSIKIYQNLGYDIFDMHIYHKNKIVLLSDKLKNKTTLLIGHSGVGKSSLINALQPSLQRKTNSISKKFHVGKHTTTYAAMLKIEKNTFVVDTPGIKNFIPDSIDQLDHYFVEIKEHSTKCYYKNCKHIQEPQCAVRSAVKENKIAFTRYQSYCNILCRNKKII